MEHLLEYLSTVMKESRKIMPVSSQYFVEEEGEIKVFSGLQSFDAPSFVEVPSLRPRVDSPAFSVMAWVQLEPGTNGANILRKPLGKLANEKHLSCWAWYVGNDAKDAFVFGAHDFAGNAEQHEEVVLGEKGSAADGQLHNVAIVVTQTNVSFWKDAELQSWHTIDRPVTDCSGRGLHIGDAGVRKLGEVTFFPYTLNQNSMLEILYAGYTLQAIAAGKEPYRPRQTELDSLAARTDSAFADAQGERAAARTLTQVESNVGRSVAELSAITPAVFPDPGIVVPKKATCREIQALGAGTSCRIIDNWTGANENDTRRVMYINLIPPSVRPPGAGSKDRLNLDHGYPKEYISYDPQAFPSFCGQSATFSLWFESDTLEGGYVLSRYASSEQVKPARWWALVLGPLRVYVNGVNGTSSAELPKDWAPPFVFMKRVSRRHVAFVFDKDKDQTLHYLDGKLLGTTQHPPGTIAAMDCNMGATNAYVGLGHRLPGAYSYKGPIQDWRYYNTTALTADHIYEIAMDKNGPAQRTCVLEDEAADSSFVDILGHDCRWFEEKSQTVPRICSTDQIKTACPLACKTKSPCWVGQDTKISPYTIWNRIMYLSEPKRGTGVICSREGIDLVKQCRDNEARPETSIAAGATGWTNVGWFGPRPFMDIDVTNCDTLAKVIDPYCSFPGGWTKQINLEIKANGGYTIEFWWKALEDTVIPVDDADWQAKPEAMRRLVFFSKVSPPRVILSIEFRTNVRETHLMMYGTCTRGDVEDIALPGIKHKAGEWYSTAVILGAKNEEGRVGQIIMQGSNKAFDFANWGWCLGEDHDFIEAIQLPGGVLMSPIHVTPQPIPVKTLQKRYYTQHSSYLVRRGPAVPDKVRASSSILYNRQAFPYPLALVTPPIILQQRRDATVTCNNKLGTHFQKALWEDTVSGETCRSPYNCDKLMDSSIALMACSSAVAPKHFFGQKLNLLDGQPKFSEFLQTVVDAHTLKRGNETFEAQQYFDAQTKVIEVILVAFSPQYGMASSLRISAHLSSRVSVDYSVTHFSSLEQERLRTYTIATFVGIAISVAILVEKILTLMHRDWLEARSGFIFDLFIQVLMPLAYFSMRYVQLANSQRYMADSIGVLSAVPWSSPDIVRENKVQSFLAGYQVLNDIIAYERSMKFFYFFFAVLQLWRLIVQMQLHPRTAMLVNTMFHALDDLWHFFILMSIVMGGYMALAIAQFGGERQEFSSNFSTFETLWDMMMGSMLQSGATLSSFWTSDPLICIFSLSYSFLVFLIMLNFIIAIIVEAYMKNKIEVESDHTEQEFFTDITSAIVVAAKVVAFGWPSHINLIKQLQTSSKIGVDYTLLRRLFPGWRRRSILRFQAHYGSYDSVRIDWVTDKGAGFLWIRTFFLFFLWVTDKAFLFFSLGDGQSFSFFFFG